jgi:hypothetical protein
MKKPTFQKTFIGVTLVSLTGLCGACNNQPQDIGQETQRSYIVF